MDSYIIKLVHQLYKWCGAKWNSRLAENCMKKEKKKTVLTYCKTAYYFEIRIVNLIKKENNFCAESLALR